jgi:chemotaxis protein MotB
MAHLRRGNRPESPIWPGFVDAMTSLLMVLMFVLTVFVLVQSVLRETIDTQDGQLDSLTLQVADLADSLGLERQKTEGLEAEVGRLGTTLTEAEAEAARQDALIATLGQQLQDREGRLADATLRITGFEAQVATLLAERDAARGQAGALTAQVADLEAAQTKALSDQEALQLALAKTRDEIDAQTEAARLDAARREALEALIAGLKTEAATRETALADTRAQVTSLQAELSDAEKARLADAAAAQALQERLKSSDAELTAMTLALEDQRKRAEETLTILAAAQAARSAAEQDLSETARKLTEAEAQAALLAVAQAQLAEQSEASTEGQRRVALLNQQVAQLTAQLGTLQGLLDASEEQDEAAKVQIDALGNRLNAALAQAASDQRRRAELEEAERKRLEAEAKALQEETKQLAQYRSEFFGRLREVLGDRPGVRIVGDRFVFSSEVLFQPGSADLAPEGASQIAGVAATLAEVAAQIPPEIDWIVRVDGHTDNVPLSGEGQFRDNWELSQGRALSVVRYMQDQLGFPPDRMAATGFGEYQPVATGDSPEARAQNRRIELKLTER